MADHYYTKQPNSRHSARSFEVLALGHSLLFETDAGVFSRGDLDDGSRLLLTALPALTGRVLDLGCGWGAIGIALGKANPEAQILMSDINERAVSLADKNAKKNGLANVNAIQSDAFENIDGCFDCIITNPPIRAGKQVIYAMFDEAHNRLTEGGALYIVIRKQQGAESALKHLKETYGNAERIERDKGFWVIKAIKEANE